VRQYSGTITDVSFGATCFFAFLTFSRRLKALFKQPFTSRMSLPLQAFMASVLKDYGLVREAAALYGKAVALEPSSVSYALNWLHALELCNEPAKALEVLPFLFSDRVLEGFGDGLDESSIW
jgi:hypothetical protein